tara:strand:- start:256 stop:867 length:612 start_codon:yes stop_codon:yes gene_type:complete
MSVRSVVPDNLGWLEYDLSKDELDYVWKCIRNKKQSMTAGLAGNIDSSFELEDTNDWFFNNCIKKLLNAYGENFENLGANIPNNNTHPYFMNSWWVNFQKKHEFNPLHDHYGVYSFVIFVKIPIDFKEQNKNNVSNTPLRSAFQFVYTDIMGGIKTEEYQLSTEDEGPMLFFPSGLHHQVYPFYDCDKERITVSGNIAINTKL